MRQRVYIAPEWAGCEWVRKAVEATHPDAEIFPRRLWRQRKEPVARKVRKAVQERLL